MKAENNTKKVIRSIINFVDCFSSIVMMIGCLCNSEVKSYMVVAAWCYLGMLLVALGWVAAGGK